MPDSSAPPHTHTQIQPRLLPLCLLMLSFVSCLSGDKEQQRLAPLNTTLSVSWKARVDKLSIACQVRLLLSLSVYSLKKNLQRPLVGVFNHGAKKTPQTFSLTPNRDGGCSGVLWLTSKSKNMHVCVSYSGLVTCPQCISCICIYLLFYITIYSHWFFCRDSVRIVVCCVDILCTFSCWME